MFRVTVTTVICASSVLSAIISFRRPVPVPAVFKRPIIEPEQSCKATKYECLSNGERELSNYLVCNLKVLKKISGFFKVKQCTEKLEKCVCLDPQNGQIVTQVKADQQCPRKFPHFRLQYSTIYVRYACIVYCKQQFL